MKNVLNNASALRSAIRGITVIAIAAIIGFGFISCGGDSSGGEKFNGQTLKAVFPLVQL